MKDTEIENLLRSLKPASASPELVQRVERDMQLAEIFRRAEAPVQSRRNTNSWAGRVTWSALGAAAAVVLMSALQRPQTAAPVVASITTPPMSAPVVTSSREWVSLDDGGIVYSDEGEPEHLLSVTSVERHRWVDPTDGAEYVVELPRQEEMYLPVSIQ